MVEETGDPVQACLLASEINWAADADGKGRTALSGLPTGPQTIRRSYLGAGRNHLPRLAHRHPMTVLVRDVVCRLSTSRMADHPLVMERSWQAASVHG